jgi:hypothetical protein
MSDPFCFIPGEMRLTAGGFLLKQCSNKDGCKYTWNAEGGGEQSEYNYPCDVKEYFIIQMITIARIYFKA